MNFLNFILFIIKFIYSSSQK